MHRCTIAVYWHRRVVGVGAADYRFARHHSVVVPVQLDARGRRALRQSARPLLVTLVALAKPFAGDSLRVKALVTLSASAHAKNRHSHPLLRSFRLTWF